MQVFGKKLNFLCFKICIFQKFVVILQPISIRRMDLTACNLVKKC